MHIEVGHGTHKGLRRGHNEDTYFADLGKGLWIVADGMGGLDSGEVASELARDTVVAETDKEESLGPAITLAHAAILQHIKNTNPDGRMGSTIGALRVTEERFEIAWVGDSRIYRYDPDSGLSQITRDHSYVQELLDRNLITADEARRSPHKNLVMQALGAVSEGELKVEMAAGQIHSGTQILLCSDGLTNEVEDAAICELLTEEPSAQQAVDSLIQSALNGGGSDNITVVLIRCK